MPISQEAIEQRDKTLRDLMKLHPSATTELIWRSPLNLLVAVILSAQATDKTVNTVTPVLFKKYRSAKAYATARLEDLDNDISRINFHGSKARNIKAAAQMLVDDFNGKVPETLGELIRLPGVGRKTANVVLGHAFNKAEGIAVDTHVARLANRFGWTDNDDPVKIEIDLMKLFPKSKWTVLSDTLIQHGRVCCKAKNPRCEMCPFPEPFCPGR